MLGITGISAGYNVNLNNLKRQQNNTLLSIGDSLTEGNNMGAGATAADRYVNRIAAAKGLTLTNIGAGGSEIPSIMQGQLGSYPLVAGENIVTILGLNDLRYNGPNPKKAEQFRENLMGLLCHAAVPAAYKVFSQTNNTTLNPAVTRGGAGWGTSTNWNGVQAQSVMGGYFSVANDYMEATVTGDTVHVCLGRLFSLGAQSVRVTIDGVTPGNGVIDLTAYAECPAGTAYWQPYVARFCGLANTAHTVRVTCITPQITIVGYIAGFDSKASPLTNLYVGNVINMTATGWNAGSPANKNSVSNAATDSQSTWLYEESGQRMYNAIIKNACETLRAEGLNITYVDTASGYTPREALDNIHPGAQGNFLFAQKFIREINRF
jgi:hypothetical protein